MIDIKTVGIASSAVIGVLGFLFREYKNKNKSIDKHNDKQDIAIHDVQDRTLVLETKMNAAEPDVAKIKYQQQLDGIRLATTEAGVSQIRGDVTEIKRVISDKLDRIPELTAALQGFEKIVASTVPRHEIEARFAALERENDKDK